MTKRRGWLLVADDSDPMGERERLAVRAEHLAGQAVQRYRSPQDREGLPLLVLTGASFDSVWLGPATDRAEVDLLSDVELQAAAERSGLGSFDWESAEAEQLRGAASALRGAAGEHWVTEQLLADGLPAPAGTRTVELVPFHRPGVDLEFRDAAGTLIDTANVKIAGGADVVLRHLEAHPDVRIVYASSDAAADAAQRGVTVIDGMAELPLEGPVVVDIGRSSADFDGQLLAALPGGIDLTEAEAVGLFDWVPWLSAGAIGLRAVLRLRAGATRAEVLRSAGRDAVVAAGALGAGKATSLLTSSEPTVLLATILGGSLAYGWLEVRRSWQAGGDADDRVAGLAERLVRRHPLPRSG